MGTFYSVIGPITTQKEYDVVKRVPEGFVLYHKEYPTSFVFFEGQVIKPKNGVIVNQPDSNWVLEEYETYIQKYGQNFTEPSYSEEDTQFDDSNSSNLDEDKNDEKEFVELIEEEDTFDVNLSEGSLMFINSILNIGEDWKLHPREASLKDFFSIMSFLAIGFLIEKGHLSTEEIANEDLTFVFRKEGVFEELKKFVSRYIEGLSDNVLSTIAYLLLAKFDGKNQEIDPNWISKFYELYKDRFKGIDFSEGRIKGYDAEKNLIFALTPKVLSNLTIDDIRHKKSLIKTIFDVNNFLYDSGFGFDLTEEETVKVLFREFLKKLIENALPSEGDILSQGSFKKTLSSFVFYGKTTTVLAVLGLFASLDDSSYEEFKNLFSQVHELYEDLTKANKEFYDEVNEVFFVTTKTNFENALEKLVNFSLKSLNSFISQKSLINEDDAYDFTIFLSFFIHDLSDANEIYKTNVLKEASEVFVENVPAETYLRSVLFSNDLNKDEVEKIIYMLHKTKTLTLLYPELSKYTDTSLLAQEIDIEKEIESRSGEFKNILSILEKLTSRTKREQIPELKYILDIVNTILSQEYNNEEHILTDKLLPILDTILEKYSDDPLKLFEVSNFVKDLIDFLNDIATKNFSSLSNSYNRDVLYTINDLSDYMIYVYDKILNSEIKAEGDKKLFYRIATTSFLTYLNKPSSLAKKLLFVSSEHLSLIGAAYSDVYIALSNLKFISSEDKEKLLRAIDKVYDSITKTFEEVERFRKITKTTIASLESMMFFLEDFIRNDLKEILSKYEKDFYSSYEKDFENLSNAYKEIYTSLFAIRSNLMFNSLTDIFEKEPPKTFPAFLESRYKTLLVDTVRRLIENSDLTQIKRLREINLVSLFNEDKSYSSFSTKEDRLDFLRIQTTLGKPRLLVRIPLPEVLKNKEHLYQMYWIDELKEYFFEKDFEELVNTTPEKYGALDILPRELSLRSLDHLFSDTETYKIGRDLQTMAASLIYRGGSYYLPVKVKEPSESLKKLISSQIYEIKKSLSSKEKAKILDKLRISLKNFDVIEYSTEDKVRLDEISAKIRIGKEVYKISVKEIGHHVYLNALVDYYKSIGKGNEEIISAVEKLGKAIMELHSDYKRNFSINTILKSLDNVDKDTFIKFVIKSAIENYVEGKSSFAISKEGNIMISPPSSYEIGEVYTGLTRTDKHHTPFNTPFSSLMAGKFLEAVKPFLGENLFNFIKDLSERYVNIVINPNGWYNATRRRININPFAHIIKGSRFPYSISLMLEEIEKYHNKKEVVREELKKKSAKPVPEAHQSSGTFDPVLSTIKAFTSTLVHELGHALANAYPNVDKEEDTKRGIDGATYYIPEFVKNYFTEELKPRIIKFLEEIKDELDLGDLFVQKLIAVATNEESSLDLLYSNYNDFIKVLKSEISSKEEEIEKKIIDLMEKYQIMNFYSFLNILEVPSTALEFYFLNGEEEFKKKYPVYYPIVKRFIDVYNKALVEEKEWNTQNS